MPTEVTAMAYMDFKNDQGLRIPASFPDSGPDHPVVDVAWHEAKAYCESTGGRLPTEAEWEYAARGGKKGLKYPNANELTHEDANFKGTGGRDTFGYTSPVGSFPPSGYHLYDMAGNVWEWTADWYDGDYYRKSPAKDPPGPETGELRVLRGGSWNFNPSGLRVSARARFDPALRVNYFGFRCAREVIP